MSKSEYNIFVRSASACVRGLMWLLGQQPLKVHYFWADVIAWLMRNVFHYRQSVIFTNLAWAFPDITYTKIETIAKQYYKHIAEIFVEAIWFGGSSIKRLHKQRLVEFENPELLSELTKDGRSIIVLDTHCGNWELLGGFSAFSYTEPPLEFGLDNMFVVYKRLTNPVSDLVFYKNRKAPIPDFKGIIESTGLLRFFLKNKDKRYLYLINNDQYPSQGVIDVGDFLNQHTTALGGTATLANKLGFAVVYMKMVNDRRGHYLISFDTIAEDASKMDPVDITKSYMSHLEAEIRETPFNWLWSHRRWKNKTPRS